MPRPVNPNYKYLNNDFRHPYELKKCKQCFAETWIQVRQSYCSRECGYASRRKPKQIRELAPGQSVHDKNPVGDRIKDYNSTWDYIKADPTRLAKHLERGTKNHAATRQWLYNYKTSYGCLDCGYNVHFSALQLDHTGTKSAEIADCRSSVKRLQQEIKDGQCVVRCANCHSVKTWCDKTGIEYNPEDYK